MPQRLSLFLALTFFLSIQPAQAADDDPVIAGKKASEWLELLEKGDKPEKRRAAVIALGIAGPKTTGAVAGLSKALREDKAPEVRREAATTIRNMGTEAIDAMEYLADALKEDKDEIVRMVSATALGRMADKA